MRSGRCRAAVLCGATLAALIAGCAAERVSGVPAPGLRAPASPSVPAVGCPFVIDSVDDRHGTTDLGHLGRTRVADDGFMPWLTDGLKSLSSHAADGAAVRHVHVTVLKAYVYGLATLKSAHVVVRVEVSAADGEPGWTQIYRGVDNSLNWSNGEAEVQLAFHQALDDLKRQIAADFAAHCRK